MAIGLGLLAIDDPGYVVLTREPYVIRLPLLLFVGILFVSFVSLYLFFNFLVGFFRAPKRYRAWRTQSHRSSAQQHTMQGYAGLIEGDWSKAETALMKKLEYNNSPLLNYLGAAYAAHQQGDLDRRNSYLDQALSKHPANALAINLTRARLLFKGGEFSASRDYLETLRKSSPRNVPVARLLADVYKELGDWNSLTKLIPDLKKMKAFSEQEINTREQIAYTNLIASPALLQGEAATWKSIPAWRKKDPEILSIYVQQLLNEDRLNDAEKELRAALNRKFDPELINLYGKINGPYLEYQIQLAESLVEKHGSSAELQLCLARLYRFNNEYARSRDQFKKAIDMGVDDEAYLDLSSLLEQMGEIDAALFFFKKGVAGQLQPNSDKKEAGQMVLPVSYTHLTLPTTSRV